MDLVPIPAPISMSWIFCTQQAASTQQCICVAISDFALCVSLTAHIFMNNHVFIIEDINARKKAKGILLPSARHLEERLL